VVVKFETSLHKREEFGRVFETKFTLGRSVTNGFIVLRPDFLEFGLVFLVVG